MSSSYSLKVRFPGQNVRGLQRARYSFLQQLFIIFTSWFHRVAYSCGIWFVSLKNVAPGGRFSLLAQVTLPSCVVAKVGPNTKSMTNPAFVGQLSPDKITATGTLPPYVKIDDGSFDETVGVSAAKLSSGPLPSYVTVTGDNVPAGTISPAKVRRRSEMKPSVVYFCVLC